MGGVELLVQYRRWRLARELLLMIAAVEVPPEVEIGSDFQLVHRGMGTVLHPKTVIGNRVQIFQGVTVGSADVFRPEPGRKLERIEIGDDAILCAGAVILAGAGVTRVGVGTVVGANAVLTRSTGDWEIWAGSPARPIGSRSVNDGVAAAES